MIFAALALMPFIDQLLEAPVDRLDTPRVMRSADGYNHCFDDYRAPVITEVRGGEGQTMTLDFVSSCVLSFVR